MLKKLNEKLNEKHMKRSLSGVGEFLMNSIKWQYSCILIHKSTLQL